MALRVVTFWASKIADPGAELGILTIPNETFVVSLSPPRVCVVCFHPALWGYYLLPTRSIIGR